MLKKSLLVLAAALLCTLPFVSMAAADQTGSSVAHVYLNINPNIAVRTLTANVNGGTMQMGDWPVEILFRVDANTQGVSIGGLVTELYKGDDPAGTEVLPIPVNLSEGLKIDPTNANEFDGGNGVADYTGPGEYTNEKGTFAGFTTEFVDFESSQNNHFSQDVLVIPTWSQSDPEKPQGQYSGYVVLYASVLDDSSEEEPQE